MIELLVVMSVLGILATAAMPLAEMTVKRNKERELKQALWEIRHAIDAYKQAADSGRIAHQAGSSGYPPSLSALVTGVSDVTNAGQLIYFLRRVPVDPLVPGGSADQPSWGLRSYVSSPELPKPGVDVFDVYSTSDQVGLNGIPYRQW